MTETNLGNPAVVGLGGFGMTTLILQFHNLGWIGVGPVLWLGLIFGGSAQLVAGLLEFKTGNNFGFCAFSGYGAFWISLCLYLIFGTNAQLDKAYPVLKLTGTDLGAFLLVWTFFTFILFIASMRHHTTLALIFLTLLLGFIGLDIKELAGNQTVGTWAAWDLIVCALLAWYLMAHVVFAEAKIHLPIGHAWIKPSKTLAGSN
jgi:succinate-acetate transporter protein